MKRSDFEEYIDTPPTPAELDVLWGQALIVPDTNVLLGTLKFSPVTADEILRVLSQLQERLWLPHRVAIEFYRGQESALAGARKAFDGLKAAYTKLGTDFRQSADNLKQEHPKHLINFDDHVNALAIFLDQQKANIRGLEAGYPDMAGISAIVAKIEWIFTGRIGPPMDSPPLVEAAIRHYLKVPPGYEDAGKRGENQLGDLIIWKQMIDVAARRKQPVLFVTNDSKVDWWTGKGDNQVPRRDLLAEFRKEAKTQFYMYSLDKFIKIANSKGAEVKREAIEEIHADERRRRREQTLARLDEVLQARAGLETRARADYERLVAETEGMDPMTRGMHMAGAGKGLAPQRMQLEMQERMLREELRAMDAGDPQG